MLKKISCVMVSLIACIVLNVYAEPNNVDGFILPQPKTLNEFHMTDDLGRVFTKESLKGHWTMMFFGFTNCGMICPTTLAEMNKMYVALQKTLPKNELPHVTLVTVDPERDSVAKMHSYVTTFNKNFVGLRGNRQETVDLEKQLHIMAEKVEGNSKSKNDYGYNHSAEVLVFNPNGDLLAYLSYPHKAAKLEKDYKTILGLKS